MTSIIRSIVTIIGITVLLTAPLTALDNGIGRILDKLDQLKLTDNTIVILLSNNGAFIIPARGMENASNYPLRGGGTTLWEGGIRVPCIVR